MTDGRLEVMFAIMGVTEEEWDQMTEEQKAEVAGQFMENMSEALRPLVEALKEDLRNLSRALEPVADSLIDMGDQIQEAKINNEFSINQLDQDEQNQVNEFVNKSQELKRSRRNHHV